MGELSNILYFIVMNLSAACSSVLLCRNFLNLRSIADRFLGYFLVFVAQVMLILLGLGLAGRISLNNALILSLYILAVSVLLCRCKLSEHGPGFGLGDTVDKLKPNLLDCFCLAFITGFAAVKIFTNLINPPFGWDSLNYHFTFAVEWFKHGNLAMPPTVFDDPSPSYYPINGSLIYLWLILPFKSVFMADIGQSLFLSICGIAVYSISRKIGIRKRYAFYAAALFILVPNLFKQLQIAYVDVMVAAFLLTALNFLLALDKEFDFKNVFLFSISLGLALGTKTTALPFIALIFIPFCIMCLKPGVARKRLFLFLLGCACIILSGGFSYIRNFIDTGNPLYPLNLTIGSFNIFKGVIDSQVYRTAVRPGDYNLVKILFSEGLGGQAILFFLPALFLGPLTLLMRSNNKAGPLITYLFILPWLFILAYRFLVPLPNIRYVYVLFGLASVIVFFVIEKHKPPKIFVFIAVAMCVLGSAAELAKRSELIFALITSFLLFFILIFNGKQIKIFLLHVKTPYLLSIFIILGFTLLAYANIDYKKYEFERYEKMVKYSGFWPDATKAWKWLNSNTKGDNIAYAGRPVPFPLYGADFKNNVFYVSVNRTEPARLHYYPASKYIWGYTSDNAKFNNFEIKGNYRGNADYPTWLSNLLQHKANYLFVYSLLQEKEIKFPIENEWALMHPDVFQPVFTNPTIRIYELKQSNRD